jgi:lectin-like protein
VIGFPAPIAAVPGGWSIGLSDLVAEGAFVWIDGSAPSFTRWNAGEPNDAAADEDCTEMDLATGGWNDIPCVGPRAFVCESG